MRARHCTRGANTKEALFVRHVYWLKPVSGYCNARWSWPILILTWLCLTERASHHARDIHRWVHTKLQTHTPTDVRARGDKNLFLSRHARTHFHTRSVTRSRLAHNTQQRGRFVRRLMKNYAPAGIDAAGSHNSPFAPNPFQLCSWDQVAVCVWRFVPRKLFSSHRD